MKIERFEEMQAWQKARKLVRNIYDITSKGDFARDYSLKDQLRRASVSVMSNRRVMPDKLTKNSISFYILL